MSPDFCLIFEEIGIMSPDFSCPLIFPDFLILWIGKFIKAYDMMSAFVGTHVGGVVSRLVAERRGWY